ncbi:MAG: hypothetical protein R2764_25800 [Bacteroidales bacterium]
MIEKPQKFTISFIRAGHEWRIPNSWNTETERKAPGRDLIWIPIAGWFIFSLEKSLCLSEIVAYSLEIVPYTMEMYSYTMEITINMSEIPCYLTEYHTYTVEFTFISEEIKPDILEKGCFNIINMLYHRESRGDTEIAERVEQNLKRMPANIDGKADWLLIEKKYSFTEAIENDILLC